jgi:hypothetical protein
MQIYENKGSNRSKSRCSYCRSEDHVARDCPQVEKDWAYWKDFVVPPPSSQLQTGGWRYYQRRNPDAWGKWYTHCKEALDKQIKYKAMANQPKPKRKASPKKCGFCGEAGHSRRNCDKMQTFLADAHKANENWRRAAYEILVKKMGLSVGAAIKVKYDNYGSDRREKIALISSINWDKLNVTCANATYGDYRQGLEIHCIVEGNTHRLSFSADDLRNTLKPTFQTVSGWSTWKYIGSVAPAPQPLDESWVTDYKDAFEYLAKKRTYKRLDEESIINLIEYWKGFGQKMTSTIS